MKSKKILDSFVRFCRRNPQLRFWQALLAWSDFAFILGIPKDRGYTWSSTVHINNHDTFYLEGK